MAVVLFWTFPPFGSAEQDYWPFWFQKWSLGFASLLLDFANDLVSLFCGSDHFAFNIWALDDQWFVTVTFKKVG